MIKVVSLFRRKPGLTREEFRDYYENQHVQLFEQYFDVPGVERYVRRYLTPIADPLTGETRDTGFDVITEVWLSDHSLFDTYYRNAEVDPEFLTFLAGDEDRFLDRPNMYVHTVEELEADYVTYSGL